LLQSQSINPFLRLATTAPELGFFPKSVAIAAVESYSMASIA
jgi:hypothetical protein